MSVPPRLSICGFSTVSYGLDSALWERTETGALARLKPFAVRRTTKICAGCGPRSTRS